MIETKTNGWLLPALGGLGCFGLMFLCFAELSRRGVPLEATFAACFGVAWILYFIERKMQGAPAIPWKEHGGAVVLAAVLCAAANAVALQALSLAPNPGYAVALFGLQGLFLTIIKGRRNWTENLGVVSLVVGAGIVAAFGSPEHTDAVPGHSGWLWVAVSVAAALLFACEYGTFSRVVRRLEQANIHRHYLTMAREGIWLPTMILFIIAFCIQAPRIELNAGTAWLLVASGLLSWAGNIASFRAISRVANPGLPLAVFAAQSMFVALLSVPLFGAELAPSAIAGMVLCVLGVLFLHWAPPQSQGQSRAIS